MKYGQLHHVEYYVNNLEATKEFWGWFLDRMGYVEYQSWPSGISYAHKFAKTYLVFVKVEPEHADFINNRQAAGLNHIAFQGSDTTDLMNIASELKQRNIKILKLKDDYLCFEDPNTFAVEIFTN